MYCQAQNGNEIPNGFMTEEIAERAVDVALTSPNDNLSFEFQGGEPLANFSVIKHIVEYTELKKNQNYHVQHCDKPHAYNSGNYRFY